MKLHSAISGYCYTTGCLSLQHLPEVTRLRCHFVGLRKYVDWGMKSENTANLPADTLFLIDISASTQRSYNSPPKMFQSSYLAFSFSLQAHLLLTGGLLCHLVFQHGHVLVKHSFTVAHVRSFVRYYREHKYSLLRN